MSITDVSKEAGVSIATVSRVLNGHRHVSDAAVKAVRAAVEKVGYQVPEDRSVGRPRTTAAGIRNGSVVVLFPDVKQEALRTTLSARLLHGIGEGLRRRGLSMMVSGLDPDGGLPACIQRKQVDGVIVRGTNAAATLCESIRDLPCVWVLESGYQQALQTDIVVEDNAAIGSIAAGRLIGRGHQRLAVINLLREHPSFRVRRMFFRDAAEQAGVDVLYLSGDEHDAVPLVDRLLAEPQRPTGLFVPGSDMQVIDVYRALTARGVKVGREIELVACINDPQWLTAMDPALAYIDIQPESIGRAAVDMLMWRLKHPKEDPRRIVVPPKLVEALGHELGK